MTDSLTGAITWLGIAACISQSAIFSGLNLAFFGLSKLGLEVELATGNRAATKVLALRADSNFLLSTILWGNVGANVLLTLLSNSVMAGVSAFFFSTFIITAIGEIMPQAYFSRNALRMGSLLSPLIRFYQILLFPVAKPTATLLDWWLGKEGIQYFREQGMRAMIRKHIEAEESDIDRLEGVGALNFLELDDLVAAKEGEPVDPKSVISLPVEDGRPVFPQFEQSPTDPFLQRIHASHKKWVIITGPAGEPRMVLNANDFLRSALLEADQTNPYAYCHRPIIVKDAHTLLGRVISRLKVYPEGPRDNVIDEDLVLVWEREKRVITGADILGRLLRGITVRTGAASH
jgi:hypothetical protein